MKRRYFIGAKSHDDSIVVAGVVTAESFDEALDKLRTRAAAEIGEGKFRVTAVSEQPQ